MLTVEPTLPMWFTLALTAAAIVAYALELLPIELRNSSEPSHDINQSSAIERNAIVSLFITAPLRKP